jgi:drug/metabolite transporter (DMT)-like permease
VSRSLKAHILLVLITLVWGATFVIIKNALADISPLLFNAIRISLAAIVLVLAYARELRRLTPAAVWAGTVVGFFLWLGFEFQTTGLKVTTASKSAFLTGMSVILVPVFLAIFWRPRVNRWTSLGVAVAFAGLYLLAVPAGAGAYLAALNRGDLLTTGCAVAWGFQIIFMGRATARHPFQQIATVEAIACALLMSVTVPLLEKPYVSWSPAVLWAIVITALGGTAAAFAVQAWAQQFTPPTHTALIFLLEPVFAWLTSYIVLAERLGPRANLGAGLILAGVVLSELKGGPERAEHDLETLDGADTRRLS